MMTRVVVSKFSVRAILSLFQFCSHCTARNPTKELAKQFFMIIAGNCHLLDMAITMYYVI